MMYSKNTKNIDNPLLKTFFKLHKKESLATLLANYAQGKKVEEIDTIWKHKKTSTWQRRREPEKCTLRYQH